MKWAADNSRIVFTHDLDFSALLAASGADGPSVIQLRAQDVLPDATGSQMVAVFRAHESELMQGAIVTVDMVSSRVRLLPLRRT